MRFNLNHGRFDPCRIVDGQEVLESDIGQSNGSALAVVNETFHGPPCVHESHPFVVKNIAVFIPRVQIVSRSKRKWSVNEVEIHKTDSEPVPTRLKRRLNPFRPMVGVPQLRGDKEILPRNRAGRESCLQRFTYLSLIPISLGTIEVSKSGLQGAPGRKSRLGRIWDQRAKAESRNLSASEIERDFFKSKFSRAIQCHFGEPATKPDREHPAGRDRGIREKRSARQERAAQRKGAAPQQQAAEQERERAAAEERARQEKEHAAQLERERKVAEERARLENERVAAEERARQEQERAD